MFMGYSSSIPDVVVYHYVPPNIYTIGACIIASSGALLFGLDVGITGGVLAMPSFLEMFFPDTYEAQQNHVETNAYCSYDSQVSGLHLLLFINHDIYDNSFFCVFIL